MKRLVLAAAATTSALMFVVLTQSAAAAEPQFGHHVRVCAQEHGFDRMHNPGMHRGLGDEHHAHCSR